MGEPFPGWLWLALPLLVAAGAAMVTAAVMRSRAEVALAGQRQEVAEARALLLTQHRAMEERVRACEQEARAQALDQFLADVHIEERHYVRPSGSGETRLVVQERVCFRNIPLSNWSERDLPGSAMLLPAPAPSARPASPGEGIPPVRPAQKPHQLTPVR
jgi:hypothetical protein